VLALISQVFYHSSGSQHLLLQHFPLVLVPQQGCPPKLVSYVRIETTGTRTETRLLFRLFRFNIETGSFGVSKQPKQTKDQLKQQQICLTFLIPHTISSVSFGCFDTVPKHRNKPKHFLGGFVKTQTEKQPKQIEFRFVSVRTEKKN
jgi:hypothetical protein